MPSGSPGRAYARMGANEAYLGWRHHCLAMSAPVLSGSPNPVAPPQLSLLLGCALLAMLLVVPGGVLAAGSPWSPAHVGGPVRNGAAVARDPNPPGSWPSGPGPTSASPALGNWSQISTKVTPPSAQSGTMIYDPVAGEFVLFGGATNGYALGATWVFSHGVWKNLSSSLSASPPARWYNSFVWDGSDGYAVLFGGRDPSTDFNDTWTFNGSAWTHLATPIAPPPITTGRSVYDPVDGYVWLYGGYSFLPGEPNSYNFTWTFHAGVWTNITAAVTGAPGDPHQVSFAAYDSEDRYVVMYGGSGSGGASCTQSGNTWSYVNGTYVNLTGAVGVAPPAASGSRMMADDPAIGAVLLYGGWDGGSCPLSNQTWVYRAGAWSAEPLPWNPGPLWDGEIAGGGPAGSILLFSGNTVEGSSSQSNQTWNFTPALQVSVAGNLTGDVPFAVHLSAVVTGVAPFSYSWSWGDGTGPDPNGSANHTYATAGTFPVTLHVQDSFGKVAKDEVNVTALPPLGVNAHAFPSAGVAPLHVTFGANESGGLAPYRYTWTFGVGSSTANGPSATFEYSTPGQYTPTLSVTDGNGRQIVSELGVTVVLPLNVSLATPSAIALRGVPVAFTTNLQDGLGPFTYAWDFGDGSQLSASANESHTYSTNGTYGVSVAVTDRLNEMVRATVDLQVVLPLTVALVANQSSVTLGQSVRFTADVLGGASPLTENWSGLPRGCPPPVTGLIVACTPSVTGTYHLSVRVDDALGEVRFAITSLVVTQSTSAPGNSASWTTWALVGAGAVGVVAVVAAAIIWRRRARPSPRAARPPPRSG